MAAHEEEVQGVVLLVGGFIRGERDLLVGRDQADDELLAHAPRGLRAHLVGDPARRDANDPPDGALRHALLRPLQRRREERLLNGVLAGGKIAITANDRDEHARCEFAQERRIESHHVFGGPAITWRTSIAMFIGLPPGPGAADASAAIAYARSGESTSTIQ